MPTPNYSIVFSAQLVAATSVQIGKLLIPSADDGTSYVVATTANRGTRRCEGVALTTWSVPEVGSVQLQQSGTIDATISGLSSGYGSKSLVRCSSTGTIERIATASVNTSTDDVIGYAEEDGRVHLYFGYPFAEMLTLIGLVTVAAGDGARVTSSGSAYTVHGPAGVTFPEKHGAVGDGVTNDTAALQAALDALEAGTYHTLELGAKTYLVTGGLELSNASNKTIRGQGEASILKVTDNAPALKILDCEHVTIQDLRLEGDGAGNLQRGISSGYSGSDGSSRGRVTNVTAYNFGDAGFLTQENPEVIGWQFANCRAISCAYGFMGVAGASFAGCQATDCTVGVALGANIAWTGGDVIENTTGFIVVAGGNDGHNVVTGANVNHNTTAITCQGIAVATTFADCDIFQGHITASSNSGILSFEGGIVDPSNVTSTNGKIRFVGVKMRSGYTPNFTESGTGYTEFVDCVGDDGTLPSYVETRVQRTLTLSDANMTLSAQESVAETIIIPSGTWTAARQLTSAWGPEVSRKVRVVNNNAQDATFKWSSGTTITIPAGYTALIGADGTNAIELDKKSSGSPTNAQYVTLATNATLTQGRVLTAGTGVSLTDGGAGSTVTVTNTGVVSLGGSNADVLVRASATTATGVSPGTSGNVLTSNGSAWTSAAPAAAGAPTNAQYLTLATDATLTQERVLDVDVGLTLADGGAGGNATVSLSGINSWGLDGQAIRKQTGSNAWEWYTPGSSGITGSDTEVMYFDGANNPAGHASWLLNDVTSVATIGGGYAVSGAGGYVSVSGSGGFVVVSSATGYLSMGAGPATAGTIRLSATGSVVQMAWRPASTNISVITTDDSSGGSIVFGDSTNGGIGVLAGDTVGLYAGGAYALKASSSALKAEVPIGGDSAASATFRFKVATVDIGAPSSGSTYTLSASEYECPILKFTNDSFGGGTVYIQAPDASGSFFAIINRLGNGGTTLGFRRASQTTPVSLANTYNCIVVHDGSNYVAVAAKTTDYAP